MKRYELFLFVLAAVLFVFPQPAWAYLDPVTGSMIWQVAVGGLLAVTAAIRIYWSKIRSLFSRKASSDDPHKH
jgi:hypothetical protein